jgi:hypothetical protein
VADDYEASFSKYASPDLDNPELFADPAERTPAVRRSVHRALTSLGSVEKILHERNAVLSDKAKATLLDVLGEEFVAALRTLMRRAGGDYRPDKRPERFPKADPSIARPAIPEGVKPDRMGRIRVVDRGAQARPRHRQPLARCVQQPA